MGKIQKTVKKEKSVGVGFRIPISLANRLDNIGVRGTVLGQIGKLFISVYEKVQAVPGKTISDEHSGVILYTTHVADDLYHVTIKTKENQILTAELNAESVANLTINLSELLNNSIDNKEKE